MKFKKLSKLLKRTSASITTESINTAILALIIIVVLFRAFAVLVPEAQAAGDEMNASNRCAAVGCFWNETIPSGEFEGCRVNSSVEGNVTPCAATTQTIPLAGLFSGSGVVFIIIMAALIVVIVRSLLPKGKK